MYVIGPGAAGTKNIIYYDLLSGTADLTVTLPNADVFSGPYLIHPNGSRIYGQADDQVYVFDPQARKVVAKFQSGLAPGTFLLNMQLSQDGLRLYGQSVTGDLVTLDAVTGYNYGSQNFGLVMPTRLFVAPAMQ